MPTIFLYNITSTLASNKMLYFLHSEQMLLSIYLSSLMFDSRVQSGEANVTHFTHLNIYEFIGLHPGFEKVNAGVIK